jgi:hypothetical protein
VCLRQKPTHSWWIKPVMAGVDICLSRGYRFSRSQEVEEGTADTNCRASS